MKGSKFKQNNDSTVINYNTISFTKQNKTINSVDYKLCTNNAGILSTFKSIIFVNPYITETFEKTFMNKIITNKSNQIIQPIITLNKSLK